MKGRAKLRRIWRQVIRSLEIMNKSNIISTVVGFLLTVKVVFPWVRFWQIDDFLDQGGSWNKEQSFCATVEEICKSIDVTEWPFWGWVLPRQK